MSTSPPDEDPGPAFPGLKMGLGGAEHAEPPPPGSYPEPAPTERMGPPRGAAPPWPRIAFSLGLLIAVALIAWLLLA